MTRHCILAFVVALLCTVTAVVLAEAGVFEGAGRWLFAQYAAESLLKSTEPGNWTWLNPVVGGIATLVVAWVAVDVVPWSARTIVFAVAALMIVFLSLTFALYGVAFNPLPSLLSAMLAWLMGGLFAETPAGRRQREWHLVIGDRLAPTTFAEWMRSEDGLFLDGEVREAAVLAVRVLDPLPTAQKARLHLAAIRRLINETRSFLIERGGVVLDVAAGDGLRAFFGFGPKGASSGPEDAAVAALALAGFLKEEATLAAQGGRPSLTCGIGLSVGSLLCGKYGPDPAPFWTATGPAAEQARQLAALNARHGTRILVGRRLAERIRDRFELCLIDGEAVQALVGAKFDLAADTAVPESFEKLDLAHPIEMDAAPEPATPAPAAPPEPQRPPELAASLDPPASAGSAAEPMPHAPESRAEPKPRRKKLRPGSPLD